MLVRGVERGQNDIKLGIYSSDLDCDGHASNLKDLGIIDVSVCEEMPNCQYDPFTEELQFMVANVDFLAVNLMKSSEGDSHKYPHNLILEYRLVNYAEHWFIL